MHMKKLLVVAMAMVLAGSAMAFSAKQTVDEVAKEAKGKDVNTMVKQALAAGVPLATLFAALKQDNVALDQIVQSITSNSADPEKAGEQAVGLAVAAGGSLGAMQQAAIAGGADPTKIVAATASGGNNNGQNNGGFGGNFGGNSGSNSHSSGIGGSGNSTSGTSASRS
jgi:hypothetical protein